MKRVPLFVPSLCLIWIACCDVASALGDSVSFVPAGSIWKFLDNGSNQGAAWTTTNFNDSAWVSGPAQFGYGEGDEATVVNYGTDANNKFTTTYFRRAFVVTNAASITNLFFRLLRDDGAVVHLNGHELYREVMATGPVTYQTFATNAVGNADETTFFTRSISPAWLTNGTNLLAVEIHQCNLTSTDLSFDLELIGQFASTGNAPPLVSITTPGDGQFFRATSPMTVSVTASDSGGSVGLVEFYSGTNRLGQDAASPYSFIWSNPTLGTHQLSAVATDNLGARGTSAVVLVSVIASNAPWPFLVSTGSVWRYLDTGVNLSNAWVAPNFDDRSWLSGRAELGYGDSADGRPEVTVIRYGSTDTNKFITTYFRRTFLATNASGFTNLFARFQCDDGAVIYLNGVEVSRYNLPSGKVSNQTLAIAAIGGTDETKMLWSRKISPTLLIEGENVIAVEVHQNTPTSSDLGFDLELVGNVAGPDTTFTLGAGQHGIVRCADAPDKSYEIYLPPGYSPSGVPLPILYTFNPSGGGMVGDFQSMAASLNIILIGVLDSINGLSWHEYGDSTHAIYRDVRQRVNYDPSAVFAGGFSGGAVESFDFCRIFGQQVAGVVSLGGWLGYQTNAYVSQLRVRTNLLVARLTGNSDTAANHFLGPDATVLRSYGAVVQDWAFSGGHEVAPDATKILGLTWLLNQRIRPGPNDRTNAMTLADAWRARLKAGETEPVMRECIASLMTKPRTWESHVADSVMDEVQSNFSMVRGIDVSSLAGGNFAQDYFHYRAYLAGAYGAWDIYFASLKALTGVTNHNGDQGISISNALAIYGIPTPMLLGASRDGNGRSDVRFSKDSLRLNYTLERRTNLVSGSWATATAVESNLGHSVWSSTFTNAGPTPAFFRLKASIY